MLIYIHVWPIFFVATWYSKVYRSTVTNNFTIIGHSVSIFVVVVIINNAAKDVPVHIFFCTCPVVSLG